MTFCIQKGQLMNSYGANQLAHWCEEALNNKGLTVVLNRLWSLYNQEDVISQ